MKLLLTKVLVVLAFFSTVFAGAFLDYFQARSENENVRLEWKTGSEENLSNFVIERKTSQSNFIDIAVIEPKGDNSLYTYVDESAYKSNDLIFVYRLRIVEKNNQFTHSSQVSVSTNLSGFKRTWGSIKAMFR
ncbi:MAG: hypothetical protein K8H86_10270 [Ignavibacteriaceae bacterium]|nr:hypothetical protein [Ignavibacteriaceae bacterium]